MSEKKKYKFPITNMGDLYDILEQFSDELISEFVEKLKYILTEPNSREAVIDLIEEYEEKLE